MNIEYGKAVQGISDLLSSLPKEKIKYTDSHGKVRQIEIESERATYLRHLEGIFIKKLSSFVYETETGERDLLLNNSDENKVRHYMNSSTDSEKKKNGPQFAKDMQKQGQLNANQYCEAASSQDSSFFNNIPPSTKRYHNKKYNLLRTKEGKLIVKKRL